MSGSADLQPAPSVLQGDNQPPTQKPFQRRSEAPTARPSFALTPTTGNPNKRLTKLQDAFVREYLIDLNAGGAMRRIGRGGKYPDQTAYTMIRLPHVAKAIQDALDKRIKPREISLDSLRARYAEFAFAQHEGPILAGHVLTALDRLGNHLGMFKPETVAVIPVQFSITGGPPLAIDNGSNAGTARTDKALASTPQMVDVTPKPEPKGR